MLPAEFRRRSVGQSVGLLVGLFVGSERVFWKTADSIEMSFGVDGLVGPRIMYSMVFTGRSFQLTSHWSYLGGR